MNENYFFSLKQYQDKANQLIKDIEETIKHLDDFPLNNDISEKLKISTCKIISKKILKLLNELIINEDNLLNFASTLRYSFETLIHLKIFFIEKEHLLRLNYSIYNHHIAKYSKLLKRAEEEILLLDEIDTFEKSLLSESVVNEKVITLPEIDELIEGNYGSNITMFFEGVKFNGYGFHQHILKEKVIKGYKAELEQLKKQRQEFEKTIIKDKFFQSIFGTKIQSNQVEKLLSDQRSWDEKSKLTNLEKEYALMYDMTSSIIHSTSYSLFTSDELNENEKKIFYSLLNQYIEKINKNIRLFCLLDVHFSDKVNVVNLVQEEIPIDNLDKKNLKMPGYCPECLFTNKKRVSMLLNSSDYFECPECSLQILNYIPSKIASILPIRGKGNIKDDYYKSEVWMKNYILSKANLEKGYAEPELTYFETVDELKTYLKTIE